MPVDFKYDADKLALYGVMNGDLSVEEFTAASKKIVSSTSHPPNIRTLWDLTGLNFSTGTRSFMDDLIDVHASLPERGLARIAFVVKDDLGYGMCRMFQLLGKDLDYKTRVFRDFSEAEEWLLLE